MTDSATTNQPGNNPPANTQGNDKPDGEKPPATFEGWLDGQPDEVKTLYTGHIEGLRNTVKATRDERDDLKKQIKDLSKTLEDGSAAKSKLDEISSKLEETTRRADFFEAAAHPGVGLQDITAAWLIVQAGGSEFVDGRGNVKFDALKEKHPVLFGRPSIPAGHAGTGHDNNNLPQPNSMNDLIRRAAGRS